MKKFLLAFAIVLSLRAGAQVDKISLQASGLTCSMCSKAVLTALKELPTVKEVQVDIKNQEYHISFHENAEVDPDAVAKAVEDAGFSVASLKLTTRMDSVRLEKDQHLRIGKLYLHFLNASGQELNGTTTVTLVDKNFTSARNYKKYSAMTRMKCVQTGRMASCCTQSEGIEGTRVYHAII